jgi:hypothetical protein
MTTQSEMHPEHLPVPLPETPPPPEDWLTRLLRQRFLLVALVILLFLGFLFTWGTLRKGKTTPGAQPTATALPHGEKTRAPAKVPEAPPPKPAAPPAATAAGPQAGQAPEPQTGGQTEPKAVPHKETTAPPAPAPAAPARPPVRGENFTRALIKIMDDQVNQTWIGWRPNSIIFGYLGLTDNVNNTQLGVLEVARRTVVVLNENMTRFATTEAYNPHINEAMNFFMVSADKYWFPSASGKYREALQNLRRYIEDLVRGRSRFYGRVDNLVVLLSNYKDLLGSSFHNLIKDTEADGKPVSWWVTDDYFYFARGIALGMSLMLDAVKEDFHQELQKKNSLKLLEDAIHALHAASHLSPWVVTNGAKDGILANHRANMSTYIGEAEHVISTLQTILATN